ncbi:MerC domain-containing protein [Dyadobacter luticola]|uniref:MerC domain-containing protein n=1 Tax=Dyadobacter luticola TaxID=1979387 RepID=A0A5R9KX54_9BACT|nr:MerC domain-containing protein [Dyadobacter luticola]TLV00751.1 MerC domain-containing protein [Dyadobacter luticola]
MKVAHSHNKADYIGILGSVLCIIHCLLMPALAFGSTFASGHDHTGFRSLDYFFILINGLAVFYATRNHKSLPLGILLWGALTLFSASLIFEGKHNIFSWLGYVGSALLIIGHLINLYICQIAPRMKEKSPDHLSY